MEDGESHGTVLPDAAREPRTISAALCAAASRSPHNGIQYVTAGGNEDFQSYPALVDEALRVLAPLQEAGIRPGAPVVIQIEDDRLFNTAFCACLFGGYRAAPVARPGSFDKESPDFERMRGILRSLENPAVVSDDPGCRGLMRLAADREYAGLRTFAISDLLGSRARGRMADPGLDDTAYLQFSSGSTGAPKGVVLTHRNLLVNTWSINQGLCLREDDVSCCWLPHTHDMGLVGFFLASIRGGIRQVKILPSAFARDPLLFLSTLTRSRATVAAAPNFSLSMMCERISAEETRSLDLSSLRVLLNGAEPISVRVMEEFTSRFAACGFAPTAMFPVYGLAEAALAVSFPVPGSAPRVFRLDRAAFQERRVARIATGQAPRIDFVAEGRPIPGVDVRIAGEKGSVLPEGRIGHVQIRGENVSPGYYGQPEAAAALTRGGWRGTGDLGFLMDSQLVVTGRFKDVIFFNGQNLYANDIEESLCLHAGIKRGECAVAGCQDPESQGEVVLVFIRFRRGCAQFAPLCAEAKRAVLRDYGLSAVRVIPVHSLPRTSSGKLRRFRLRDEYLKGTYAETLRELDRIAATGNAADRAGEPPDTDRERGLRSLWAEVLGRPAEELGVTETFRELGGTSLKAMAFLSLLEKRMGIVCDHDTFLHAPTIRSLASALNALPAAAPSSLRSLAQATEARRRHVRRQADACRDIAVVGIGLRFPGARSTAEFWSLLERGLCPVREVSEERRRLARVTAWDGWMAAVDGVEEFDAEFFGISPRDAAFMDPQQRLLLQVVYHAFEDAGLIGTLARYPSIGVYIGASHNSYQEIVRDYLRESGEAAPPLTLVGNSLNMLAARISHAYNLHGPSLCVDSACSSSLVALHQAVCALRRQEITHAVVGTANLLLTPMTHLLSGRAGILSPTGTCRVFDANADGTVLGEGVAAVILQPLGSAVEQKRPLYGVVKGIGVNNDGQSLGIMAPNPTGQQRAILEAFMDAGVEPSSIGYVEAHGTGTAIGDPVEIRSLEQVFAEFRTREGPCAIGSVKSNIGHLLPAAGLAGLIKALLCLQHRTLVPSINIGTLQSSMAAAPFAPVRERRDWDRAGAGTLRACVSAFGFGGTNVHVVLEGRDAPPPQAASRPLPRLLAVSGRTARAYLSTLAALHEFLTTLGEESVPAAAMNRARWREHGPVRRAFLFSGKSDLLSQLQAALREEPPRPVRLSPSISARVGVLPLTRGSEVWPGYGSPEDGLDAGLALVRLLEDWGWSITGLVAPAALRAEMEGRTRHPVDYAEPGDVFLGWEVGGARTVLDAGSPDVLGGVKAVYDRGWAWDWESFYGGCGDERLALPLQEFARDRHWLACHGNEGS